jgi:beta-glucosidase
MINNSRLGIPLDIIEETLHGGMDNGTIFPMPCALGASWNLTLVQSVARIIGTEARIGGVSRAFSPELQVSIRRVAPAFLLDFKNRAGTCANHCHLFGTLSGLHGCIALQVDTDPRFGRTEEAFGEDPKLVSDMGVAYTLGMTNGNTAGPASYLDSSAVATEAKHFAAYGNSGKGMRVVVRV